ncbi:MAG TPA: type IV toxin-antitoxin system AbiEi family antitoxin domain-containing protein [Intrasporangiaceae bacterium]|nr:type IV toxin-antitoxin system AbiEi family antitoxin domain-containing protein [Intrasporangiaceae bacterium]
MDLDALLRRQHGVLTHAQAVRAGLTEDAIRWRITKGDWTRIVRGIYHAYPGQLDWFGRAHALTLRLGPHAALTMAAAAHLHGVETRQPPILTAAVSGRQVQRLPGTRIVRRDGLATVIRQGLPVTTAPTTVLDLTAQPGVLWREAVHVSARWIHSGRTTPNDLADALAARARHPHRRVINLALTPIAEGVESVLELQALDRVIDRHGLPRPRLQVPAVIPAGRIRRDAEWEEFGVVLEVDGDSAHTGEAARIDRRRDRHTARSGRLTLRAGFVEIEFEQCELAVDIFLTLRSRGYRKPIVPCTPRCPARLLPAVS